MVEEIHFSTLRLTECEHDEPMDSDMLEWFETQYSTHNEAIIAKSKHYAARSGYLTAQKTLLNGSTGRDILSRAIKGLQNLTSVSINLYNRRIGAHELYGAFGVLRGDQLIYDGSLTLHPFMDAVRTARVPLEGLRLEQVDRDCEKFDPHDYYRSHSKHSSPLGAILPSLLETADHTCGYLSATDISTSFAWLRDASPTLVQSLQTLSFKNLVLGASWDSDLDDAGGIIHSIMWRLNQLRTLSFENILYSHNPGLPLEQMIAISQLKNLQTLVISDIAFTEDDFVDMVKNLSKTLISARLVKCYMSKNHSAQDPNHEGSWPSAISRARDLNYAALRIFILNGCARGVEIHPQGVVDIADYLTKKVDKLPWE